MNVVSSLTGTGGGAGGTGFAGPAQAGIINPVTDAQTKQAYTDSQAGITNAADFLAAVRAQNGLQNQSNVFNQLQNVASGTGPNPAMTMLNTATGANTANTAAAIASARGVSQNPGMVARTAAGIGAQNEQQAAGQAANMQANQSLNALNSMGNIATNQAGQYGQAVGQQVSATQGEQANLLNAVGNVNNANVGSTASVNSGNATLANTRMGQQANVFGGVMNGVGTAVGTLFAEGGGVPASGAVAGKGPRSKVVQYLTSPTDTGPTNAVAPKDPLSAGANSMGNAMGSGIKTLAQKLFPSDGSGPLSPVSQNTMLYNTEGKFGTGMTAPGFEDKGSGLGLMTGTAMSGDDSAPLTQGSMNPEQFKAARGGRVPAMVSPGEQYLPPSDVKKVVTGKAQPLKTGERVPGTPKYPGNDYRNDTVPKTLEAGGVVIPNEIMQSPDRERKAAEFVRACAARQGLKPTMKRKS